MHDGDHAERVRAAAVMLATFAVGLGVPDLDFLLPFGHRSALTHSILPLLLILAHPAGRSLLPGLALGIGVHLSADSFPNAMTGFARIRLPLAGALSPAWSYVWLGSNALAAVMIGATTAGRLLPRVWALGVLAAVVLGSVAYLFVTDGGWPALLVYAAAGAAGWRWRRQRSS
ncbi:MAG: hypothetical protein V4537_03010 [Pseudomonadota bacterium]